jgi:exopolysaccharide biosynthesis protein/uncharacterized lipoprotein YddW (UPF0748 family)
MRLARISVLLVLGLAWLAPSAVRGAELPITVTEIDTQQQGRRTRGFVATIDLRDPRVEIVVTQPRPEAEGVEAKRVGTDVWRERTSTVLAINANFYGSLANNGADIVGLSMTDGRTVSPVRVFGGEPDPALVFREDGSAAAGRFATADLAGVVDAVAGVGGSTTDIDPGTLLVTDGVNTGATARVQPSVRNPRTAAGVSADGSTLILAVIDGRQPGWSDGVTLPELADLMIQHGAHRAINLDGGGSTSFVYDDGETTFENRPSDGAHRAVANHLGVRINREQSLIPAEDRRPIRGVWLRPPTQLSSLDAILGELAEAGVQDLFLETFYWGLATNDSDVFQDRFGFDYLREAIELAARYGIRVHAWLESAYWSFGGTGDYILDQHPEWKIVDYLGDTDIGDIGGQVFVNLGHPGVQVTLGDYCEELATGYPGLWGIQTDYHRFPLDNNTGDGNPAPYSYDTRSRQIFQIVTGFDPIDFGPTPSGPLWDQFTEFRRSGIAECAGVMHSAIEDADPGLQFSGAVFAQAMTNPSQLVKMQDWPRMAANGWLPLVVPMAYGTSTSSIRSDLSSAISHASGARVVPGLAILTNINRPTITQQLNTAAGQGLHDFIFFEGTVISGSASRQNELRSYLLANGPFQSGDFNRDLEIDAADWDAFYAVYQGDPVAANNPPPFLDVNGDGVIDAEDEARFLAQFKAFRFGADGFVGEKERRAFELSLGATPGGSNGDHLFDLNGNGVVDQADMNRLASISDEPFPIDCGVADLAPPFGVLDLTDINFFILGFLSRTPNADLAAPAGVFDLADINAFVTGFGAGCP